MKACQAVDALLTAHLLGALDGNEGALVEDHLMSCAACRAARQDTAFCLEEVNAPAQAPPAQVWNAIRARIERAGGDDPVRGASLEAVIHLACSFCRGGLIRRNAVYCASCLAPHHSDCFDEYGRCSVMGCGEQRVVLPRAVPEPRPPEPIPPKRWPWLLLAVASGGVLAAAAFGPRVEEQTILPPLARSPHHRDAPGEPLFQVEVKAATLEELTRDLATAAGQPIELPSRAKHHVLFRASWRDRTWTEVVSDAGRRFGLVFEPQQGDRSARLVEGPGYVSGPLEAPAELEVERTIIDGPNGQVELWQGRGQRVLPAPTGNGLAVLARSGVYLYLGDRQVASADGAPLAAAWSSDGYGLAVLLAGPTQARLVLFDLHQGRAKQHELAALKLAPVRALAPSLAWLEDGLLICDGTKVSKLSFAAQATTYVSPSPRGESVFRLHSLGPQRFVIERRNRIETWSAAPLEKLSECPVAERYSLSLCRGDPPLALVIAPNELQSVLLDGRTPVNSPTPLAARRPDDPDAAGLAPTGRFVAWVGNSVAYVRHLEGNTETLVLPTGISRVDVLGVRWGQLEAVAYWTAKSVYMIDAAKLDFTSSTPLRPWTIFNDTDSWGRIHDVDWCGDQLVITTRQRTLRKPRVRVARVD
ncbi:MAG: zf-HC2 domain-containing protein [Planctomycetes bacterium]|nr:zf-HC2 domain-containing protein [Planctomycetota bacterium]